MNHIGLICPEMTGHLNPMTTLGRELQRRGHRVSLISRPDGASKAASAGLGFIPVGEQDYGPGSTAATAEALGKLSGLAALRFTIEALRQAVAVIFRDGPMAIQQAGVDALLVDQVSPAGGTVADRLGIPFVTVCNALSLHRDRNVPPAITGWRYLPGPLGRLRNFLGYALQDRATRPIWDLLQSQRAQWNLPRLKGRGAVDSRLAQIAQQPALFDFPRSALPSCFHYTGPFHDGASGSPVPFPYQKLSGKPIIYASMGTLQNRLQGVFRTVALACEGLEAQLVISLGSGNQEIPEDLPGSPLVVSYAPQLDLLKRAALVITHAGLNTTLESLAQGVPLAAIPITNDQPAVAARIAWLGLGEVVPLSRLSVDRLRIGVRQVLEDDRYRSRANAARNVIAQADGLRTAAGIAEKALSTGEPVVR